MEDVLGGKVHRLVKFALGEFSDVTMKIVVVAMLGNPERSMAVKIASPWTYS